MIVAGIDPGLTGAVALLFDDGRIWVLDTPTLAVGMKREYDINAMARILDGPARQNIHAAIERQQAMPAVLRGRQQGGVSSFRTGFGYGIWLGILGALQIPYTPIHPVRWKKALLDGMPRDKDSSILRAKQLFPTANFSRKKDHGRAEALLIAEFLRRSMSGA